MCGAMWPHKRQGACRVLYPPDSRQHLPCSCSVDECAESAVGWPAWVKQVAAAQRRLTQRNLCANPCTQVAGITDDDFVYTSFTNAALGTTPYIIVLHR